MRPTAKRYPMRRRALVTAVSLCFAGAAIANPQGPAVVSGSASFASAGKTLTVTNSPGAIIDWQRFSIDAGEATRFLQQNAASAVLNRVRGGDPSQILGTLQSNGRVFLINPNGITFGAGAQVDVAGLVASTLNLSDADFLAGRLDFSPRAGAGGIANHGEIRAASGGQIVLVAPNVENSGLIAAPNGDVLLAAGKSVRLVDINNPEIQVEVSAPANGVLNLGTLAARQVGLFGGAIRHGGTVSANAVEVDDHGRILFRAVGNVTVDAGSRIEANGPGGGEISLRSLHGDTIVQGAVAATGGTAGGGRIEVLGDRVAVRGEAVLDASGQTGGGTILVGGDYQGSNPEVANAHRTYVGRDARLSVDARSQGDGGKVIVWADDTTAAYGTITARGGEQGGDGGLVEVSGRHSLNFDGRVNTLAPKGKAGTLLLDPETITVVGGSAGLDDSQVTDFTINASDGVGLDYTISENTLEALESSILLEAKEKITIGTSANPLSDGVLTTYGGYPIVTSFTLRTTNSSAAGGIFFDNSSNELHTGFGQSLTLEAGGLGSLVNLGKITATNGGGTGGSITLSATGGGIDLKNDVSTAGLPNGTVSMYAGSGGISMPAANKVIANGLQIVSAGPVTLAGANEVGSLAANLYGGSGSLQFMNNPSLTLNAITTNGGAIDIQSANGSLTAMSAIRPYGGAVNLASNLSGSGTVAFSSISSITSAGNVNIRADNFSLGVAVIGGADVGIAPFSNSRDVCVGGGCGAAMNITTADLSRITASGILIVGRPVADPSYLGTLYLKAGTTLTDLEVGAPRIALNGRNVIFEPGSGIAAAATPLTRNVDILANENVSIGSDIYLGTGQNLLVSAGANPSGTLNLGASTLSANNINLTIPAGNITQSAGGQLLATGNLEVMATGAVNIGLGGGGNQAGLFKAQTNGGSITYTSSGPANLGLLSAPGATVTVTAGSNITDGNGSGTKNIWAANAVLTANGTIEADTEVGTLTVDNGATAGAITLRNLAGALQAGISGNAGVSLSNNGSIAISSLSGSGLVSVAAAGASSDIDLAVGSSVSGTDVSFDAGRDINITGASVTATTGNANLMAGNNINITGATGSSGIVHAGSDVLLKATVGKLFINSGGSDARVEANGPSSVVYLDLPGQTTGGYVIDGVEGGATTSGVNPNTGIFAGTALSPAVLGSNFIVSYGLPTLAECIADPTLPGCTSVLPSISTCIAAPTTPGCEVVLPSISTCIAAPTTLGCSAVLPSLATCIAAPTTPGCQVVLPTLETCTSAPTLPGCSVVLPTLETCIAAPTTPGCSAVLPSPTTCAAVPTTPGCPAQLPTLETCIAAPATPGCGSVLPSVSTCTSAPATPGCSVVLPSLEACIAAPATPGCSAVLPTLSQCIATPTLPGCSVVLPTLAQCLADPALAGCSAVLPTLAQCIATPTLPGCAAVLPTTAECLANPTLPGCPAIDPEIVASRETVLLQEGLQPAGDDGKGGRRRQDGSDRGQPPPQDIRNVRQLPVCR